MVDNATYAGQQLAAVGGGHLFLAIHTAIRSNAEALAPCRGFFHAHFQSLCRGCTMNNFLTQREVSQVLGVSERTIQWWRQHGRFPQPHYIGRTPVYLRSVLDAWFAESNVTVTNGGKSEH